MPVFKMYLSVSKFHKKHSSQVAVKQAELLIQRSRMEYKTFRSHSSLTYRPPALVAILTTKVVHTDQGCTGDRTCKRRRTMTG